MSKSDFEERRQLELHLEAQAKHAGWSQYWEARDFAPRLQRDAGIIKRIEEAFCSVEMDDAETARLERRSELAEKRIQKVAKALGISATTGGDPRGCCAYLHFTYADHKPHNTWGGEESGWGL